jgi:hypothetical protein
MTDQETSSDAALRHALLNGGGNDLATQSRALERILAKLEKIATREEMQAEIHNSLAIHIESCAAARAKPSPLSKFSLSRAGVEGQGWGVATVLVLAVVLGFVLFYAIPHLAEWLIAWKGVSP